MRSRPAEAARASGREKPGQVPWDCGNAQDCHTVRCEAPRVDAGVCVCVLERRVNFFIKRG